MKFWRALLSLAPACVLVLLPALALAQDHASPHGKTMIRSYELPAALLDRYNEAIQAQKADSATLLAGLEGWTGTAFSASNGGNPYTLVVRVLASAVEDEDIGVHWQPLWSGSRGTMAGMGVPGARPGELLQMVATSAPEDFHANRQVTPGLLLAAAKNIRMELVRVEVWSGAGETSWLDAALEWWPLIIGTLVWGAFIVFFYLERKKARQTPVDGGP